MNFLDDCNPKYRPTAAELRRKSFRKVSADIVEWNSQFFKITRISSGVVKGSNGRFLKELELTLLEQPASD